MGNTIFGITTFKCLRMVCHGMDLDGRGIKVSSIFFIFKHVDKFVVHLLNIYSEFVNNFFIGLEFGVKLGVGNTILKL